ncbi:T9SS type A sorting domain-containing protein [uncultured Aquimarina sp.]
MYLFNYIVKNEEGVYKYDVDILCVASGVYIVNIGDNSNRITEKIIVR